MSGKKKKRISIFISRDFSQNLSKQCFKFTYQILHNAAYRGKKNTDFFELSFGIAIKLRGGGGGETIALS